MNNNLSCDSQLTDPDICSQDREPYDDHDTDHDTDPSYTSSEYKIVKQPYTAPKVYSLADNKKNLKVNGLLSTTFPEEKYKKNFHFVLDCNIHFSHKYLSRVHGTCKNTAIYTCLLYTSPSPRDQRGSRMPSSA